MKGSYKFGVGLLVVVVLLIAVIQAAQKEPINWRETYNPKDKIPFGTYVIRHELSHIFDNNESVRPIEQSLYTYLQDSVSGQSPQQQDLIFIGTGFNPGEASIGSLLNFIRQGNNVLLSTYYLSKKLQDTLKLSIATFNSYKAEGLSYSRDSVSYVLVPDSITAGFNVHNDEQTFFDKLDSANATILGYLRRGNLMLPNFVRIRFGKGYCYLQLTPDVYSNYYLLKTNPRTYPIAYTSLHYLNGRHILWYDSWYDADAAQTPLRFILSRPALRDAWYLLLVALLLLLLFKTRREQAAIPIVKPEENLSVAFAETIGSLYYENGHPGNMMTKKIDYFLYDLKKDFRLDTAADIRQSAFRKQTALRLKLPEEDIHAFFDRLIHYQNIPQPAIADLKALQKLIEDFKQKIYPR